MAFYSADGTHGMGLGSLKPISIKVNEFATNTIYDISIRPWQTVKDLKQKLHKLLGHAAGQQRLFLNGIELNNSRTLQDYNICSSDVLSFALRPTLGQEDVVLEVYADSPSSEYLKTLIQSCRQALSVGLAPKLTLDGTGGTYLLRDRTKRIAAVFKPQDEEAFAPNNPRGYVGKIGQAGFRNGILSGEAASREVAGYLLDRNHFSSVPATCLVEAMHSSFHMEGGKKMTYKTGSLQEYVNHDDVAGNFSCSLFPRHEVHKIGILDIRLLNTDRNEANILVVRRRSKEDHHKTLYELIPIDHGLTLPDTLEICSYDLTWMSWPQAKEPFDETALKYIEALDPDADANMLRKVLAIRETCLRNMRITGLLLKKGASAGLSLFEIGSILCRDDFDQPSELEYVVKQAELVAKALLKNGHSKVLPFKENNLMRLMNGFSPLKPVTVNQDPDNLLPFEQEEKRQSEVMEMSKIVSGIENIELHVGEKQTQDAASSNSRVRLRDPSLSVDIEEAASPAYSPAQSPLSASSASTAVSDRSAESSGFVISLAPMMPSTDVSPMLSSSSIPSETSTPSPSPSRAVAMSVDSNMSLSPLGVVDANTNSLSSNALRRSISLSVLPVFDVQKENIERKTSIAEPIYLTRSTTIVEGDAKKLKSSKSTRLSNFGSARKPICEQGEEEYMLDAKFFEYLGRLLDQLIVRKLEKRKPKRSSPVMDEDSSPRRRALTAANHDVDHSTGSRKASF
eukprot:GILK01003684.1.p1 GENE.GILK01003684.1~~GILK01003684.1.p1  ORF type:complete len:739 (-),score=166.20 GILK01003684.1:243-2459(-)